MKTIRTSTGLMGDNHPFQHLQNLISIVLNRIVAPYYSSNKTFHNHFNIQFVKDTEHISLQKYVIHSSGLPNPLIYYL